MITISDQNEVFIAGGDDNKIHIYLNEGDGFTSYSTLSDSNYNVKVADITGDGKWILSTDNYYQLVLIYKFSLETQKYESYQKIAVEDYLYAGTITDDHIWVAIGGSDGFLYIYTFDGNKFVHNQTINFSATIFSLTLTNDHLMLAVATYSYVYIYTHDGTEFSLIQTIYEGSLFTRVSWTDDHQYLTFAETYPHNAYVYNNTEGSYKEIESNGQFNKESVDRIYYFSFGFGKKLLAASKETGLELYSNFDEGEAVLDQILDDGQLVNTHEISKDGTYIILGNLNLKVFINDDYEKCNISYCTKCLNSTYCEYCNGLLEYFVNDTTGNCELCSISRCRECQNLMVCQSCEEDYFVNEEGECSLCNMTGCS